MISLILLPFSFLPVSFCANVVLIYLVVMDLMLYKEFNK